MFYFGIFTHYNLVESQTDDGENRYMDPKSIEEQAICLNCYQSI